MVRSDMMVALPGLVQLLHHCHGWMQLKDTLSASLTFKQMIPSRISQPLGTRRVIGSMTIFHHMYYGEAPELLCQLFP